MGHFLLSAEARFSAAHTLPGVDQCDRFHGHLWRVRVTVRIEERALNATGMGIDFRDLERVAQGAVAEFEHRYLNDLEVFREQPPTAERIAQVVAARTRHELARLSPSAEVDEIAVWELPEYRVVYRPR